VVNTFGTRRGSYTSTVTVISGGSRCYIMISNAITKVLEFVVVTSSSYVDEYQFGFKAKHSTGLCTNVLKRTIDYYTERGSYVFCSFVDFSKTFDRVNYWKLFNKLLDDNVAYEYDVVKLLSFWYSNQSVSVRITMVEYAISHLAFKMVLDKALFYHPFSSHVTFVWYCVV